MTTPKALLQFHDGAPLTPCIAAAWEGLRFLGYDCEAFDTRRHLGEATPDAIAAASLPALPPGAIVVGGVQACHAAFAQLGAAKPEPIDYPEYLWPWLGREVRRATLPEAHRALRTAPWFVKPIRPKAFTGDVFESGAELYDATAHLDEDEPVWISGVVDFVSEYRCFVSGGGLSGIRHYRGDPWVLPSKVDVVSMVRASAPMGRAGFSIDVGVTKDGRTLLVECNDGYALGYYGLDSLAYAELLIARWRQIVGVALPEVPDASAASEGPGVESGSSKPARRPTIHSSDAEDAPPEVHRAFEENRCPAQALGCPGEPGLPCIRTGNDWYRGPDGRLWDVHAVRVNRGASR